MNKIKRIILDFDHVIAQSDTAFIKAYEKLHGVAPLGYTTKKWDFTDCLPNIDKSLIMPTFASDLFFDYLEPYPDVIEEIAKIRDMGIEVIIASQSSPMAIGKKAQWIDKRFPNIGQYPKLDSGKDKSYLSLGEGDLFIDDHHTILDTVSAEYKLMFVGVKGRDWQDDNKYAVFQAWKGFFDIVKGLNCAVDTFSNMKGGK